MEKKIFIDLIILSFIVFLILNLNLAIKIEGDGVGYYSWLNSIVIDHDINFRNQLEYFSSYDKNSQKTLKNPVGKVLNPFPFGTALMWLPFFLLAHIFSLVFKNLNSDFFSPNGYSFFYVFAIHFGTWVFGILALLINLKILKKIFDSDFAIKMGIPILIAVWLATPWVFYQIRAPFMSHIPGLFVVSYFWLLVIKLWQGEKINKWLLAISIFLMISIRWQNSLFILVYLLLLLSKVKKNWPLDKKNLFGIIKELSFIIFPVSIFILIQSLLWKNIYGEYFLIPQGPGFISLRFHGLYTLFSSNHGLLLWSPILFLSFFGFYWLWQKSRFLASATLLAFISQWLINSSLSDLGGGDAFGARRFIETLPFFILAMAALFEKLKPYQKILITIIGIAVVWNLILIENYRVAAIPFAGEFDFLKVDYLKQIETDISQVILSIKRFF